MLRSDAAMVRASLTVLARLATRGLEYVADPDDERPALGRLRPGDGRDEDKERDDEELQTLQRHRDRTPTCGGYVSAGANPQ